MIKLFECRTAFDCNIARQRAQQSEWLSGRLQQEKREEKLRLTQPGIFPRVVVQNWILFSLLSMSRGWKVISLLLLFHVHSFLSRSFVVAFAVLSWKYFLEWLLHRTNVERVEVLKPPHRHFNLQIAFFSLPLLLGFFNFTTERRDSLVDVWQTYECLSWKIHYRFPVHTRMTYEKALNLI